MSNEMIEIPLGAFKLTKLHLQTDNSCKVFFEVNKLEEYSATGFKKGSMLWPSWSANETLLNEIHKLRDHLCSVRNVQADKYQNIKVTMVELYGSEDKRTYKIKGTDKSHHEQLRPIETEKIHFKEAIYCNEEKIREIIDKIEELSHAYLFDSENGRAQKTMPLKSQNKDEIEEDE